MLPIEADLFGAEQWSPAMFWNELANGHHYLVAADADGAVLGYAGLTVTAPDEAWVQNIAVRRDAQRRGIGRLLLEALLAEADRRGIPQHPAGGRGRTTRRPSGSTPAYGFEPIGVRRGYYQPSNTDALVMRRDEDG